MHWLWLLKKIALVFSLLLLIILCLPVGYFVLNKSAIQPSSSEKIISLRGVGAYLINLDRSKDRYDYVIKNLKLLELPITRIAAVDGKRLSTAEVAAHVDLEAYKNFLGHYPKLGTIGCSLSHYKAWQTFIDSDFEFAVIFEDDVQFDPTKLAAVIKELTQKPALWDICNFETHHRGWPLAIKTVADKQQLVVYFNQVTHAGAYLLNRKAARKLLEKFFPIKMPIDHYFTRIWELDLKFTGIEPRLVLQQFGTSEIGATKKTVDLESKTIVMQVKRMMYTVQSFVIRFLYTLKLYVQLRGQE